VSNHEEQMDEDALMASACDLGNWMPSLVVGESIDTARQWGSAAP